MCNRKLFAKKEGVISDFMNRKFKYTTFSPKPFKNTVNTKFYSNAFQHWLNFWRDEYSSYGSNLTLNPNDFFRQDLYTVLSYDDRIIGTHALTFFDLNFDLSSYPYLNFMYPKGTLEQLKRDNINTVMALQFFMMDPEFRYKKIGLNLAYVIASLSTMHKDIFGVDGAITAARTEVGAAKVAQLCGYKKVSDEHLVHNVPVVTMLCREQVRSDLEKENLLINQLWETKNTFEQGVNYEIKRSA
jgi:hypothetical protein